MKLTSKDFDADGYYIASDSLTTDSLKIENVSTVRFRGYLSVGGYLDVRHKGISLVSLRQYVGLYKYIVWATIATDGQRWVRMGCLFKSLEQWEAEGGIRQSNLSQFPDHGSDKCEERVAAFEFAKAAALRMKMPEVAK